MKAAHTIGGRNQILARQVILKLWTGTLAGDSDA